MNENEEKIQINFYLSLFLNPKKKAFSKFEKVINAVAPASSYIKKKLSDILNSPKA